MKKQLITFFLVLGSLYTTPLLAQVDSAELKKAQQEIESDKRDARKLDQKIDRKQRKIDRKARRLERKQRRLERKERKRNNKEKSINREERKLDKIQQDSTGKH